VVNYDSTARQDAFPAFLQERGVLDAALAERLVKLLGERMRIGAALAEAGVKLEGEELLQTLRDYAREKVAQVLGMREGRFAFYAGTEFADEVPTIEIPTLSTVLEGARRTFAVRVFANALREKLDRFPARTPEFGRDLPALGLDTRDLKIAMQVNGRIPLRDVIAHGRGDFRLTWSLFWFLDLVGAVGFSSTPAQGHDPRTSGIEEKIAPRKKKPLPAETVRELRDAAVKIITGSYFRVLGLGIDADTEQVERAYHDVAQRFHPDSYPEFDTSELQDLLDSVQDKLAASYRVLSSEERRKPYLQYLLGRLDTGRSGTINVEAEVALRRGELALKRRDWRSALEAFEEAVSLNPREPEYYSYLAWATYQLRQGGAGERAKAAQKVLKKALSLNPYLERPQIISAIIDGEQGDHAGARKKLLKVLELNPGSQLAKAALRKVGR
jgi:tetratricopeptide (TPR) repeat protein